MSINFDINEHLNLNSYSLFCFESDSKVMSKTLAVKVLEAIPNIIKTQYQVKNKFLDIPLVELITIGGLSQITNYKLNSMETGLTIVDWYTFNNSENGKFSNYVIVNKVEIQNPVFQNDSIIASVSGTVKAILYTNLIKYSEQHFNQQGV
jgi:hypothetical protein